MKYKIALVGDWDKARAIFTGVRQDKLKKALQVALHQEGLFLATKIKKKIDAGPHEPLSPLTLAARRLAGLGGTKPLIATGGLRNAITVWPNAPGLTKFVGVMRTARRKGKSLANIAQIQEEGRTFVVKITDKMRRYLFGVLFPAAGITPGGGGASRGYIVVKIKPRPFIGPVLEEFGPTSPDRIEATFAKALNGDFGTVAGAAGGGVAGDQARKST